MAGGGFHVEPEELRGYGSLLERTAGHFASIERHATDKGGDTSGFTGLLALLVPVVNGVVGLYAQTLQLANRKITEVKDGLDQTAAGYERQDQAGATNVTAAGAGLGGAD
ncbi:MAG TPA: type VII secretion target [Actinophytocola sp.]|uniref:type VII secretion target n=1 Tax=Actinophytocola sp. TaxID=1872138 RepID=UPI002DDD391D|nr:type VII secretion target [Actinophytocola sp.]HEV2783155.1 type VII secretion target [Actinophytocola sp.]